MWLWHVSLISSPVQVRDSDCFCRVENQDKQSGNHNPNSKASFGEKSSRKQRVQWSGYLKRTFKDRKDILNYDAKYPVISLPPGSSSVKLGILIWRSIGRTRRSKQEDADGVSLSLLNSEDIVLQSTKVETLISNNFSWSALLSGKVLFQELHPLTADL